MLYKGRENKKQFEQLNKNQFKKWAKFYDFFLTAVYFRFLYKKIIEILEERRDEYLFSGARLLDVACGTGEIIYRLSQEFPKVEFIGVDFSDAMLEKARKKTLGFKNVKIIQANAERLPFQNQVFDIVICSEAFHHFAEPEKSLMEINRVLKSNSLFLLVEVAFDNIFQKAIFSLLKRIEVINKYYSKKELKFLLERFGFQIGSILTHCFNNYFICAKTKLINEKI